MTMNILSEIAERLLSIALGPELEKFLPPWAVDAALIIGLLAAGFVAGQRFQKWRDAGKMFVADMHPKEVARYLAHEAAWGANFKDALRWQEETDLALRDALSSGRIKAQGRAPGKWESGTFHFSAEIIPTNFWRGSAVLNWLKMIDPVFDQDIDAHSRESNVTYADVRFCRAEIEAVWPKRSWLARKMKPSVFDFDVGVIPAIAS